MKEYLQRQENLLPQSLPPLASPLLGWYDRGARVLPWRENPTPYRVWISEIMLQQTRVQAVLPYFTRFVEALPTVESLAGASQEVLMKLWEGLGYYSRARNLQKAAQVVMERYNGTLPASYEGLLELPGIGPYTAGAVASIAYGLPVPAVDGNVLRVFARVLACEEDVLSPRIKKEFTRMAAQLMPQDRPGDFNQALMELGATVCLPGGAPRCGECPVRSLCRGYELGIAQSLPVKGEKKPRVVQQRTVVVVLAGNRLLLHKRPDKGLLAGLWELPNWEGALSPAQTAQKLEELGAQPGEGTPLGEARHIFTHIQWDMTGYLFQCPPFSPPEGCVWVDREQLEGEYSVPSAFGAYRKQAMDRLDDTVT